MVHIKNKKDQEGKLSSGFSVENIMVILFSSIFTFFMFGFAIISIIIFFTKYKEISEFDKKLGFKIVLIKFI